MHIKNKNNYIFKKFLVIGYSIFCSTLFGSERPWFRRKQAVPWPPWMCASSVVYHVLVWELILFFSLGIWCSYLFLMDYFMNE